MNPPAPAAAIARSATSAAAATDAHVGRHRFACFHVFATFVLLIAGASVTSNDAGISVTDWPSSLGFFNPLAVHLRGLMHGLVAIEHGHREIAMVVGLLTIVETVWLWTTAQRRSHRVLGVALLLGVLLQGSLGGLTVMLRLPPAVSVAHGMIAQSFFCLSIATACVLSPGWRAARPPAATPAARALRRAALVAMGAVVLQLLLGAIVRHTVAKWRVPTFLDLPVVLHAAFAAAVVVAIGLLVARIASAPAASAGVDAGAAPALGRPALLLGALVIGQAAIGLLTIVTRTDPLVTVLHVVTGASILGLCMVLVLRTWRLAPPDGSAP